MAFVDVMLKETDANFIMVVTAGTRVPPIRSCVARPLADTTRIGKS